MTSQDSRQRTSDTSREAQLDRGHVVTKGRFARNAAMLASAVLVATSGRVAASTAGATDILALGARPDGCDAKATTAAFKQALSRGGPILLPAGEFLIDDTLVLAQNSRLTGAGMGTDKNVRARTILRFTNLGAKPAIVTRQGPETGLTCGLENLMILAATWTGRGACLGPGCVFEAPVVMRGCYVGNFRRSNILMHHNERQNGPYQSLLENVFSAYSGEHGCVIGTGAHAVTLVNCRFFWNGSPEFGKAPHRPGQFDGLIVTAQGEGNPGSHLRPSIPTSLNILGGDASYNSRYGWNIDQLAASDIRTGFAEHNLRPQPGQVRIGRDVDRCHIVIPTASGFEAGVHLDPAPSASTRNTLFVCGRQVVRGTADQQLRQHQ